MLNEICARFPAWEIHLQNDLEIQDWLQNSQTPLHYSSKHNGLRKAWPQPPTQVPSPSLPASASILKGPHLHVCGHYSPLVQALSIPLAMNWPVATLRPKVICSGGIVHSGEWSQESSPSRLWEEAQGHWVRNRCVRGPRVQSGARGPVKCVPLAPHTRHSVWRGWRQPEESQNKSL